MLEKQGINPGWWAKWSVFVWLDYKMAKKPGQKPPINWVWSAKRMSEHLAWYQDSGYTEVSWAVTAPAALTEYVQRYKLMRRDLWQSWAPEMTNREINEIVAYYFPRDPDHMATAARRACENARARLQSAAAAGVWLW